MGTYYCCSAYVLIHLLERIVVVVIGRAEIGLASGEPLRHFYVEESISHAKSFLHMCPLLDVLDLGWQHRAEQATHLLVAL